MPNISSILGGGGVPVGAYIQALDAPINFTQNGQEFLLAGNIKAYSAAYAQSIAQAPQLRVFGANSTTYGTSTGGNQWRYYYVGTQYMAFATGITGQYDAALSSLASTMVTANTQVNKRVATNGTYIVVPSNQVNVALSLFTAGNSNLQAGGTFTTCSIKTAICFGNNSWLALSTIAGSLGEQAYINNANPTGAWTVGAATNLGMNSVTAISYGAGVFVAVSADATSATTRKIATCASVGGAWTDRTAASGITFAASETILDVVFDGTEHVAVTSLGRIISSATPTGTWTLRAVPFDCSIYAPWNVPMTGAAAVNGISADVLELNTDGAGTIVAYASTGLKSGVLYHRPTFAISTDHGATWAVCQIYVGKAAPYVGSATACRTLSYANGRWIANVAGNYQALVDIGPSLATPDYIGQQNAQGQANFVRIK